MVSENSGVMAMHPPWKVIIFQMNRSGVVKGGLIKLWENMIRERISKLPRHTLAVLMDKIVQLRWTENVLIIEYSNALQVFIVSENEKPTNTTVSKALAGKIQQQLPFDHLLFRAAPIV